MKSLSTLILASVLALTACGGGGGGTSGGFPMIPPVVQPPAPSVPICTVSLFGDSIVHGGYPMMLKEQGSNVSSEFVPVASNLKMHRPNYEVKDFSYSGGNALDYAGTFLQQNLDSQILVVEFGVNDAGNSLSYEVPMRAMLERAKALNKKIIVTGIVKSATGFPRYNEYNEVAKSLAKEYGATWGGWDEVAFNFATDAPDGLHPSQEYSTRLVQRLAQAMDVVSPECK
jgi:lysophospholipase L1-like esterase